MRSSSRLLSLLTLVLLSVPVQAQGTPKPVREYWDAAYLEGVKAGYFHTFIVESERDGQKLFTTTQVMRLKVRRDGKVVELKMDAGNEETADGKLVGVSFTMYTEKAKLTVNGRVEGDKLVMRGADGRELKRLPWDGDAIGLYAQDRIWKEKKVKPGDAFDFTTYELSIEKAFKLKVKVKEPEETVVLEENKNDPKAASQRVKRSLLRVEGKPDKVEVGGAVLQLPPIISWLDKEWNVIRSETSVPGLGSIITFRTTKAEALEEGTTPGLLPDLLVTTLLPVNKDIERPYDRAEIVYRVTMTGDDDPKTAFARDFRQSAENAKDNVFDLRVRAQRALAIVETPQKVADEYRIPSHFLDSADDTVRALTARAVGIETEPWAKAKRIEKWVFQNMKGTSAIVFATASQVARDLQGDCRQHALLTAAMCRAAGLPSRTALGLLYVIDRDKGPVLAFHMWTEVYVANQWMALDATLGMGGIGPTHLKVADQSWHETQTLAPLLSVLRVLDKIKVEIIAVK